MTVFFSDLATADQCVEHLRKVQCTKKHLAFDEQVKILQQTADSGIKPNKKRKSSAYVYLLTVGKSLFSILLSSIANLLKMHFLFQIKEMFSWVELARNSELKLHKINLSNNNYAHKRPRFVTTK